jgi:hypothetical protein
MIFTATFGKAPKTSTHTHKYCAMAHPREIDDGKSEVRFKPCMTVTDAHDGVLAYNISIMPPANSTASGGCPEDQAHLLSELECEITEVGSRASGSGVTDYVNMNLRWSSTTPFEGHVVSEREKDTMTLSVTTTAAGQHTGSGVVTFVSKEIGYE